MNTGGSPVYGEPSPVIRAPLSATVVESPQSLHPMHTSKLPRLHYCAYRGDVEGILQCINEGCSLHETISLRNQHGRLVCGITALFLAAQRGHGEIVKLLVTNGASPVQPCFIQGSTELCTPAEVASLNLHFKLARWLKSAARARRREDEVLALDDEERMSQVSSRLARGLVRARSTRSLSSVPMHGSTSGALGRFSRGSRTGGMGGGAAAAAAGGFNDAASVQSSGPHAVPPRLEQLGYGGAEDQENDPQRLAALNFVQNVDLAAFDPDCPAYVAGPGKGQRGPVARLFRRLMSWGGSGSHPPAASAAGVMGGLHGGGAVRASASQRVRNGGGGGGAGGGGGGGMGAGAGGGGGGSGVARNLAMDLEAVDPARPDHTKVLQRFLKDLDLAHWQPEQDGPLESSVAGGNANPASSSTRPTSPSRSRASPPASARGNVSPARSRA
ncbi:hypothetical protein Agub_g5300 [Astrephomene gubernaculifera]|uniref:ANK_REP_REGION domain-containing protein n=1 Tax=Astrephomene gubernaculifera TaxID=47775 RepID=A0AAD3HKX5_9CHLO|nr:hypothetical protein Agub_g5300 [Astrephomene gubernaculifera]